MIHTDLYRCRRLGGKIENERNTERYHVAHVIGPFLQTDSDSLNPVSRNKTILRVIILFL